MSVNLKMPKWNPLLHSPKPVPLTSFFLHLQPLTTSSETPCGGPISVSFCGINPSFTLLQAPSLSRCTYSPPPSSRPCFCLPLRPRNQFSDACPIVFSPPCQCLGERCCLVFPGLPSIFVGGSDLLGGGEIRSLRNSDFSRTHP
jgi:hypothetical protein